MSVNFFRLMNKRGTAAVARTFYHRSSTQSKPVFGCEAETLQVKVFFDSDVLPAVGDIVFTSSTGTANIGTGIWALAVDDLSTDILFVLTTDNTGEITQFYSCIEP